MTASRDPSYRLHSFQVEEPVLEAEEMKCGHVRDYTLHRCMAAPAGRHPRRRTPLVECGRWAESGSTALAHWLRVENMSAPEMYTPIITIITIIFSPWDLYHRGQSCWQTPTSSVTAASEAAAYRKEVKYSDLPASFSFQPIAVETLGPINESAVDFLRELGRRISSKCQEERQSAYLF